MLVKCIGGLADGQIINIEYQHENDIVRVPARITFEISNFEDDVLAFREGRTPQSSATPYYYYRVCSIYSTDEHKHKHKLLFLCPEKWTYFEALCYALGT